MRRLCRSSHLSLLGSAKTQLAHWYTEKTKHSLTTAVLRALVPKTTTVPQAKRLVQLGISYQTLEDIRCTSCTDANFGKSTRRRTKPSLRETCGPDPNLRSRASALMPHLLLYLYFCYQPAFLKATAYPKESPVCRDGL